jgi:hypothetical protein
MRSVASGLSGLCTLCLVLGAQAQPVEPDEPQPDEEPTVDPEPVDGQPVEGQPVEGEPVDPAQVGPMPTLPEGHPPIGGTKEGPAPAPTTDLPPVPLAPPTIFPSQLEDEEAGEQLVGFHSGRFYVRHPKDTFRLYPGGRLRTDFLWSPGAADLTAEQGASDLEPRFVVRRVRLELSGELFERLAFTMGMELGGLRVGGDASFSGADTPRFAMSTAHDGVILPAEVSVTYRFRDWLNFTAGQFNAPITMSNRTSETKVTPMERPLAIRSFVVPNDKELGLMIWGELFGDRTLNYELGIFSGDGPTRPAVDARPDFIGRIFARPLTSLGDSTFFQQAQIGVSGRYGSRDQELVDYDVPNIASSQGFVIWQPGYVDSLDRVTHVIPSGDQGVIGGELRLPFDLPGGRGLDIQGEAYYVLSNTREAVDGFQLTNTERFGAIEGVGWYGQISAWLCGDAFVSGEPGIHRPVTVDLGKEDVVLKGLELFGLVGGIHASYAGATRQDSVADQNTPDSNISVMQFGGGLQYWYGWNFRAAVNYMGYFTPDSEDPASNLAIVPDNLRVENNERGAGHFHHELGARLTVSF